MSGNFSSTFSKAHELLIFSRLVAQFLYLRHGQGRYLLEHIPLLHFLLLNYIRQLHALCSCVVFLYPGHLFYTLCHKTIAAAFNNYLIVHAVTVTIQHL